MSLSDALTRLPIMSTVQSEPMWIPGSRTDQLSLSTAHRQSFGGHIHKTKIPGHPDCLIGRSKKPDVSAYRSTLPLYADTSRYGSYTVNKPQKDVKWLENEFNSKQVLNGCRRSDSVELLSTGHWNTPATHYTSFFPPKKSEKLPNYQPKHIPLKTPGIFDSKSTYSSEYLPNDFNISDIRYEIKKHSNKNILKWQEHQRSQYDLHMKRKSLPPIETETSYRNQYTYRNPEEQFRLYGPPTTKHKSTMVYKGNETSPQIQTTYTDSYYGHVIPDQLRASSIGALNREMLASEMKFNHLVPYQERTDILYTNVKHD